MSSTTATPHVPAADPALPGSAALKALVAAVVQELQARSAPQPEPWPLLIAQEDVPRFLGISRTNFFRLKSADRLPKPVHVEGSGLRYRRSDLERYVERLKPARE